MHLMSKIAYNLSLPFQATIPLVLNNANTFGPASATGNSEKPLLATLACSTSDPNPIGSGNRVKLMMPF